MKKNRYGFGHILALGLALSVTFGVTGAFAADEEITLETVEVVGTAAEQVKQSLGSSIITKEDIEKNPPVNDLSEIIRRQPGVNLTGNSASGSRGNNRQIDLRGMGPENTLILIDGRPVKSRNSVRYGWTEERDTRGDSNWVPAEMVERIEVLRGPAAARYGSGAMGGVVNIITKKPEDKFTGSMTFMGNIQEDAQEGDSYRFNASVGGPVNDSVFFRIYGGINYRDADAKSINEGEAAYGGAETVAGREGYRNRDINALLTWEVNKQQTVELTGGYSRQGNIYAGDSMQNFGNDYTESLYGEETNVMRRKNIAATHTGDWNWGHTRFDISYDSTVNTRLNEGLAGGLEGEITDTPTYEPGMAESEFNTLLTSVQADIPLNLFGFAQTLTVGAEYLGESLDDKGSLRNSPAMTWLNIDLEGYNPGKTDEDVYSYAFYIEDNIYLGSGVTLTPGVRVDEHETFGSNVSPSLNASYEINSNWTVKGGVARAYKAPNLYQGNPNYLLYSRGTGCYGGASSLGGGCYLQGNEDLDPETSINKEIGIAYDSDSFRASATYFHNDYDNKVYAGKKSVATVNGNRDVYQWENAGDAIIQGVEGNVFVALGKDIDFNTNVTYMIESELKRTGQPLSIVPEYTVNTFIDWRAADRLSLGVNATLYGEQETPSIEIRTEREIEKDTIDPYALVGISAKYQVFENVSLSAGVNNIFDKQLNRKGNSASASASASADGAEKANAYTYNEVGRSYWLSMTTEF
ncbi:TonB-dependent siderophore receptor [Geovibrio thiophilus]|uniref:TonB-dependent siderophore receptor n=1 Tax=Geovibrio thiophilus TaxID=139438 RepID=A0A3R5V3F6_9BACT|nr:TonB-dependent siderophore receptor [Geovibrio thiophilus]